MQAVFQRYEEKYMVSPEQRAELESALHRHMEPDRYGDYLVQNLYFDTEDWEVIRASIEKPPYKEKLRLRCYDIPNHDSRIFLELKKKYKGIVYKRRIAFSFRELESRPVHDIVSEECSQIGRELCYYLSGKALRQRVYLAYHRNAWKGTEDEGLRVTLDRDIRFRAERLNYIEPDSGSILLPQGQSVMEIKTPGGMPLWLCRLLSDMTLFPVKFSKYGACYRDFIARPTTDERKVPASA